MSDDVIDDVVETNAVDGADTQNDVPTTTDEKDDGKQDVVAEADEQTQDVVNPTKNRAEERIRQLVQERNEWRAKVEQLEKSQGKTEMVEPKLDDFENWEDFQKAINRYHVDLAKQELRAEAEQSKHQEQQTKYQADVHLALDELEAQGIDMQSYFEKAEGLPPLPVTLDNFGLSAKETFLLAKDLLDDESLYLELSQLPLHQFAARIGVMIDKRQSEATKPPKQSKAPAPINPVGGNTPAKRDIYELSDDEFLKARGLA